MQMIYEEFAAKSVKNKEAYRKKQKQPEALNTYITTMKTSHYNTELLCINLDSSGMVARKTGLTRIHMVYHSNITHS